MDNQTAKILCQINSDFYRQLSSSFSATRQHPWHGWKNLEILQDLYSGASPDSSPDLRVFDLACGNLRFEFFLASKLPDANIKFYAVDNCDTLVPDLPSQAVPGSNTLDVSYQSLDVLESLQKGQNLSQQLLAPSCDLSVSFGFMHHVPLQEWREAILRTLVQKTRPGGYLIFSFWQFLNDAAMAKKAQTTHQRALKELGLPELDDGDYLLGWQDTQGLYRYCHSFSELEIDQLILTVANEATLVSQFVSDGRTDNLNTYLVLRKT